MGNNQITWPFATLTVNKDKLELNGSICGTFIFRPSDVESIELYNYGLRSALKINHFVDSYREKMIFIPINGCAELLNSIKQTGFLENYAPVSYETELEIADIQNNGAFPIKTGPAIAILLIWNGLILGNMFDLFGDLKEGFPLAGVEMALMFLLIIAALLLIAEPVRLLILKPGRSIAPIKPFIYFTIILATLMLLGLMLFMEIGIKKLLM